MWIFYASLATLSSSIRRVYDKRLTNHFGNLSMPLVINLFSLFTLLPLLFFFPMPHDIWHLSARFWIPLLLSSVIVYQVQVYLYVRAIREGELSAVAPIMTITPVFNIVTSLVLLGEVPSILGTLGIAAVAIGTYLIVEKKIPTTVKWRPEVFMAGSMFCFALGSSLDKVAITASTAVFYSVANMLISIVVQFIVVYVADQQNDLKKIRVHFRDILLVGSLLTVSFVGAELAFSYGPTAYVLAIRNGAFVITTIWAVIKLKESFSLQKGIAIALFFAGGLLLAFA